MSLHFKIPSTLPVYQDWRYLFSKLRAGTH